ADAGDAGGAGTEVPALHKKVGGGPERQGVGLNPERQGFSPGGRGPRATRPARKPAWWAARATTGAVTPGFTKSEILKAPPEDPRAPDGVLERVTSLLLALSDER